MRPRSAWLIGSVTVIVLAVGCSATPTESTPTPASSPSGVGAIPDAIDATVTDPSFVGPKDLRAVMVSVDDKVVAEKYYGSSASEYFDQQSVTKVVL